MDDVVADEVEARTELGFLVGEPGELAVAAVDDGREQEEERARDLRARGTTRKEQPPRDADRHRGERDLVRRDSGRHEQAGGGAGETTVDEAREPTVAPAREPRRRRIFRRAARG